MAQFDALVKRYRENQEWLDFRAGLICAVIANANRDPKKGKAFKPQDFMPKQETKKEARKELTQEQIAERVKMMAYAFGANITKE